MKKVILLVILVIFVAIVLLWNVVRKRRRNKHEIRSERREAERKSLPGRTYGGLEQGNAKADFILSEDGSLLSYSILIKKSAKPIESVHFSVGGERVKQISIPPGTPAGEDIILHGLWRSKDSISFTPALVNSLKEGQLKVEVKFAE